ncbi:MAG: efflux RND transporter periplasmic adaptor subunit [Bacteroidia bacterium]
MKSFAYSVITLLLLSGCGADQPEGENKTGAAQIQNGTIVLPAAPEQIVAIGKVEPQGGIVNLSATSGGVIIEIFKDDGDFVKEGEPLLRLDDDLEKLKIDQFKTQIKTQQTQIELDKAAIIETEIQLADKKRNLLSAQNLVRKGAETTRAADDLGAEVDILNANLNKGKLAVQLSQNRLGELYEQLKVYQLEAQKKTLRSPYNGVILDMTVKAGSALSLYESFADLAPEGNTIIRAEVDELFSDKVKSGQLAEIRFVGSAETIATGKVTFLSPYLSKKSLFSERANDQEDRRVREIHISLEGNPSLLLNAKVECVIKL